MQRLLVPLITAMAALTSTAASADAATLETATNDAGDQVVYDGTFYSFRSADHKSMFKLWMPPQDRPVRALLLFGNPGGGYGGDTRDKTVQRDLLTFAVRRGMAVGGVTGFPGRDTYQEQGKYIVRGLEVMAGLGHHAELANIPMIFTGGSNAGFFSYSMACLVPERTIAITPNVGGYFSTEPPAAVHDVPMWIHIGVLDPLITDGVPRTQALFRHAWQDDRPLWVWDAEMKGHENGAADHVDMAFWQVMLDARLPDDMPTDGPVELNKLDFDSGFVADLRSWDHAITRVFPADELPDDAEPGRYGWIPDESLVRLYQATATRARPLLLSLESPAPGSAQGTSGVFLSAGLSTIVSPGDEVVLKLDTIPLAWGIDTIEIWDRNEKLGQVDYGDGENRFRFTVDGDKLVYALYAYATQERRGGIVERISAPLQLVVRDPSLDEAVESAIEATRYRNVLKAVAEPPTPVDATLDPLPGPQSLQAGRHDPEAEAPARDGRISSVWDQAPQAITVDSANALAGKTSPVSVSTRSLWSQEGLYLLFEVTDPTWSQATDRLFDTIDFHIAPADPARLVASQPMDRSRYIMPEAYRLLRGAVQMQIPIGEADSSPRVMLNYWTPWDPNRTTLSPDDDFGGTGIWTDRVVLNEGRRALELFLPWHAVGFPGLSQAPQPGTRLSFVQLYSDEGTASTLSWPNGLNPWAVRATPGGTSPFGQIVLTGAD
jgi:hypothetical protein